jgi:hypothetical protein
MKTWDLSKKNEWDLTGCIAEDSEGHIGYITGVKDMPYGKCWVGNRIDGCRDWCATKPLILADSVEEYNKNGQKLAYVIATEAFDSINKYFDEFRKLSWWARRKEHHAHRFTVMVYRNITCTCCECDHKFSATLPRIDADAEKDIPQKLFAVAKCPYCGAKHQQQKGMTWENLISSSKYLPGVDWSHIGRLEQIVHPEEVE